MKDFKLHEEDKVTSGFKAPDGYFNDFTERLMAQLPQQPNVKILPLYKRKPVWLSAAAVFLVTLGGGWFFMLNTPGTAQPDAADIENYLVYSTNVSTYDLTQQLDDQDIKQLEASLAISDKAIEDYLIDEDIYE